MKYLYVLTSDERDYYLEQTVLSMTSLRMQMPDAFISLLVDNNTETTLTGNRRDILELVNEFKSITIEEKFNQKARSRWLKTSMRQNIGGDFLYIDGDTIIAEDLSPLKDMDIDVGAVFDAHISVPESEKYNKTRLKNLKASCVRLGLKQCFDLNVYFNGGVIFCRDNKGGHDFFNEWHRLWLHCFSLGSLKDQQSLNQANFNLGGIIKELSGIWNCQILDDGALRYLHNAKIIHYFSSRPGEKAFILANDQYAESIRKNGSVDETIRGMIKNAKSLFVPNIRIMLIERSSQEFYDSAFYGVARRIFSTKFGAAVEFILARIRGKIYMPLRRKLSKRK